MFPVHPKVLVAEQVQARVHVVDEPPPPPPPPLLAYPPLLPPL
jgi:hypothetical protein